MNKRNLTQHFTPKALVWVCVPLSSHLCASGCVLGAATVWRTPCHRFYKRTVKCESWCAFLGLPDWRTPSRSIYNWRISSFGRRSAAACAWAVPSTWSKTCYTSHIEISPLPQWVWAARPRRSAGFPSRCGLWRRCPRARTGSRRWGTGRWGEGTGAGCW